MRHARQAARRRGDPLTLLPNQTGPRVTLLQAALLRPLALGRLLRHDLERRRRLPLAPKEERRDERRDPHRADGASLADRLDAHAAVLETTAQRSTNTAANVTAARAVLLAECRVVRAAWAGARVIDPHVPKLDLRIVRAEVAVSRRVKRLDATTDASAADPAPAPGPATSTPPQAEPAPEPIAMPTTPPLTEPDGPTTTVRVTATVEVIEASDLDPCEPSSV